MRYDEITTDLKEASFEYFYWFSRLEFVLKENGYLKNTEVGSKAEPSWMKFIQQFNNEYSLSDEASSLIELHPKRQIVTNPGGLGWKPVGIEHCNNDLAKVITMLSTIRNNLFHGGKHGDIDVDSVQRNISLLKNGKIVLDQIAEQFNFEADYTRYY